LSDQSNATQQPDLRQEIQVLRASRRQLVVQHCVVPLLGVVFVLALREAEVATADAWWLTGIAFGLITWAAGRAIADTVATLEEDCPSCAEPFFGGVERAHLSLPLLPTSCASCGLRLDERPGSQPESDSTPG
jgi:hypothetical protein